MVPRSFIIRVIRKVSFIECQIIKKFDSTNTNLVLVLYKANLTVVSESAIVWRSMLELLLYTYLIIIFYKYIGENIVSNTYIGIKLSDLAFTRTNIMHNFQPISKIEMPCAKVHEKRPE